MSSPTLRHGDLPLCSRLLLSLAGVMGACGIGVGAAGAHAGGGSLASLASSFLLIHAAAVLALGTGAAARWPAWPFCTAGALLAIGTSAFSGDLAVLAFTGAHAFRFFAPIGGVVMILGWVVVAVLPWFGKATSSAEL